MRPSSRASLHFVTQFHTWTFALLNPVHKIPTSRHVLYRAWDLTRFRVVAQLIHSGRTTDSLHYLHLLRTSTCRQLLW